MSPREQKGKANNMGGSLADGTGVDDSPSLTVVPAFDNVLGARYEHLRRPTVSLDPGRTLFGCFGFVRRL